MKAAITKTHLLAFILLFFVFSCSKEFSFEQHIAKGTLKDMYGTCFPPTMHGTLYNGILPGDTTYIAVTVNVQQTGSYMISTNLQNGMQFADSGFFNAVGMTTVRLKPAGIPLDHIVADFIMIFDTSACPIAINTLDSSLLNHERVEDTLPLNNWRFTDVDKGVTHTGLFEENYIYELGLQKMLVLSTKEAAGPGDSTFMINIILPNNTIEEGTYSTDDSPNGMIFRTYDDACLNCAGGGLIPLSTGATVIFVITGYDPSSGTVKGRFSGTTMDALEKIAPIEKGEFSAVMQ